MPTHFIHEKRNTFYFVTFTCYKWLRLIDKTAAYDFFPKWIREINKRGVLNCGYVFMPNHIHLIVYVMENSKGVNHVIGEAKRFLAYELVNRLKIQNESRLLGILEKGVREKEKQNGKKHQVFRLSFDAEEIFDEEQFYKTLDYIHHNPVSKKWNLVDNYLDYEHSSARFYEYGEIGNIQVYHYQEVTELQSMKSTNDTNRKRG